MAKVWGLKSKVTTNVLSGLALAIALSVGGYVLSGGGSSSNQPGSGTVDVSATGSATGMPDTLSVELTVTTNASSAATALNKNDTEMRHLQSVFTSNGVLSRDLQTTGLSVSPNYNNKGKVTGYGAEDDLSVTLHNIAKAGKVIDSAEDAVGNDVSINNISFSLSNTSRLDKDARARAMQNARSEALDFARGGGEALGPIEKITSTQSSSTPPPFEPAIGASARGSAASPVPVSAGTEQVSVQVDVVYRLVS
jgi:uncharacterized protein YggE